MLALRLSMVGSMLGAIIAKRKQVAGTFRAFC